MHYFLKFNFGIKLYMFRTVPLSIIRSFSLHTQQWYMSYRFADNLRSGSGRIQFYIIYFFKFNLLKYRSICALIVYS